MPPPRHGRTSTPHPRRRRDALADVCPPSHRKETAAEPPGRRAKISTRAADPAMGWTSPLPAVRMRAAMLVSAVVATCRGRLRRGAIREEVLADEPQGWFRRSSCEGCQPDCLRLIPAASQCTRTQYNIIYIRRCVLCCRYRVLQPGQLSVRRRDGSRTDCCPGLRISNPRAQQR